MKKSLKKIMTVGLAAVLCGSMLAGCGGGSSSGGSSAAADDGTITIKFVHKFPEELRSAFFDQIVAEFEEANPGIHIEMTSYGDEEIKDKIRVLLGSDDAPDIYFTWSGERIMQYVNSGNAMDITSYFEEDADWTGSFNETILSTCNKDGAYWAVPWDYSCKQMVYNKAIFAEAGVEAVPTTWDELLDACEKIKAAGYVPISVGNQYSWVICHYITSLNGKLVDQATIEANYNNEDTNFAAPGYAQALDLLKELYDLGYINSDVNSCTWETSQSMVQEGQAAMIYEEVQNLVDYDKALGDNLGIFDLPEVNGAGETGYITGGPDVFMVNADCAHPDEAILFLKWITSDSVQSRMCYELGFMPVTGVELDASKCLEETLAVITKNLEAPGISEWLDCVLNQTVADTYLIGCQTIFDGETGASIMEQVSATAEEVAND